MLDGLLDITTVPAEPPPVALMRSSWGVTVQAGDDRLVLSLTDALHLRFLLALWLEGTE